MKKGVERIELLLAITIGILLVASVLSTKIFIIPAEIVSILILSFVIVKVYQIIKNRGTVLEDYISVALIVLFGILYYILGTTNALIVTVLIFLLAYSIGLIPFMNDILKSKKVTLFILSYAFFVLIIILLFAGAYSANSTEFTNYGNPTSLHFEDTIYFSIITFTTVGYGDIAPTGTNKLIASIQSLTGVILNIAFIGYVLASHRFRRR